MSEETINIKRYPRVTVRIPPARFLKLKAKYSKRGEISKVVNKCLDCMLENPDCRALRR